MREITNELQVEHPAHARRLELLRANHSTLSMAMSVVEDRNAVGVLLFDPLDPLVLTMELVTPEWQQRAAGNWAEAGSYHPLVGTPVNRQELAEMVGVVRPWIGEALTHDAEDGATWTVVIAFGDITLAACTFPLATPAGQA
jgi:hypothetical protein